MRLSPVDWLMFMMQNRNGVASPPVGTTRLMWAEKGAPDFRIAGHGIAAECRPSRAIGRTAKYLPFCAS
jgi:hypothetical protein